MTVGRQQPGGEAIAVLNLDSPPPEEASNRTFIILAVLLGGIFVLGLFCIGLYAVFIGPRQVANRNLAATVNAANTQTIASNTQAAATMTAAVESAAGTADTVSAGLNDTVAIAGVPPGAVVVRLADVERSCVAPPDIDHSVSDLDSSRVVLAVSCPAPAAPAGLRAVLVDTTRIDLAWDASGPDSVIAGYRVYRDGALHGSAPGTAK